MAAEELTPLNLIYESLVRTCEQLDRMHEEHHAMVIEVGRLAITIDNLQRELQATRLVEKRVEKIEDRLHDSVIKRKVVVVIGGTFAAIAGAAGSWFIPILLKVFAG